jgi:hypothetical protein
MTGKKYQRKKYQSNFKQEGHDGPEIAHLNKETLHDNEKVIL